MLLLQCCALLKFLVVDDQSMCNFLLLTKLATYGTCSTCTCVIATWAQLFEGRLALNVRLNLTEVSFSCVQKHFLG